MTAASGAAELPPPASSPGVRPTPPAPSPDTYSFLDSYTPLNTFPVLLQQAQKRTHALFINNVGLKPQPFLPAVEEKLKIKLHDEYFFPPPVSSVPPAPSVPSGCSSAPSLAPPPFASLGTQESTDGKARARPSLALPSSSSGTTGSSPPETAGLKAGSVCTPGMTVGELVVELSAHLAASSATTPSRSPTLHGDVSTRTVALRSEGAAESSKVVGLNGTSAAATGGGESLGASGVLSSLGTGRGELANLRLKNLPAALRPTWHAPWKLHRVISGHLGWVTCLAVDPTNDWFATGEGGSCRNGISFTSGSGSRILYSWYLAPRCRSLHGTHI